IGTEPTARSHGGKRGGRPLALVFPGVRNTARRGSVLAGSSRSTRSKTPGTGGERRREARMEIRADSSGYSYKEWVGSFYPEKLPAREMLRSYAERLPTVEINNTFYRLPKASVVETWASQVPDGFRFTVKASQRITHRKRLVGAGDETA